MNTVGKIIKELREFKEFSQTEFANLLGINRTSLSKIESDKQELDLETAKKLSIVCEVSLDYVVGISPSKFPPNTEFKLSFEEESIVSIYRDLDEFSRGCLLGTAFTLLQDPNKIIRYTKKK